MEADSFIFCQNDLISSSFSAFEAMKKSGELVDFKVTIQNRCFFAHRLVLAAGIPYLRAMFASSTSEISLQGIDPDVFENVIDFAYCGKIKISAGNVRSLLEAAQLLQLTSVHDACVKYMAMRINVNNVFAVRAFAGNIQSLRLAVTCDRCILRNFEAFLFSQKDEFLQLPFAYVKEIISRDDLHVTKEEKVYEALMMWIKASPAERLGFMPDLLSAVRMTCITPQYLVERVAAEELVMSSTPCKYLVEETKNYHLLPKNRTWSSGLLSTSPRNTSGHGVYAICHSALGYSVDMFDAEKEMWVTLCHIGTVLQSDHVVGFNRKLYIFTNLKYEIETFDTITLKRETLSISQGSCKLENCFKQIVLHDSKFYAFTSDRILCFDPKLIRWQVVEFCSIECENSGIASLGQYIYVTGGWIQCAPSKISKRYNPSIFHESKISPMLVGRRFHGCTGLNNKLYVCGGMFLQSTEVYDPATNQWSFISPMKITEFSISLCAYKDKVYALGKDKMEIYDPQHNIWKYGSPAPRSCTFWKYMFIPCS